MKTVSRSQNRSRVLVIQRRLTHYRVPFFEALRAQMASCGMELVVAHGAPTPIERDKHDEGVLAWAVPLSTNYLLNGRICWQPFATLARASDLVVLTHENKLVCNLAAQYLSRQCKVALWGHGANLQGDSSSWRERFKRRTATQADWWFGYTEVSRPLIRRTGFPSERITILNNTIDTIELASQFASVAEERRDYLCRELGLQGHSVGVFVGSLYTEKRISFLLDAAVAVRERVPGFELLIAGAGPDAALVQAFQTKHDWIRYVGLRTGQDKADLLSIARIMLNPGAVGLGILDSFVCQVPMVTTDCGSHGPEIAYLESGFNGVMANNDHCSFVDSVASVLENCEYLAHLVAGCAQSASKYTVDNMARNFCQGAENCMNIPISRSWI